MLKRLVATLICAIALPAFAQYEGDFMGNPTPLPPAKIFPPGSIVELTDILWVEYMAKSAKSALGTYERCGTYLFTYTPKGKEKEKLAPMVGFAYPNRDGKIGMTVLRANNLIHVSETTDKTRVASYRDESKAEHFDVFLAKDDMKKMRSCKKIAIEKKK